MEGDDPEAAVNRQVNVGLALHDRHPNPLELGGVEWNRNGAHGHQRRQGKTHTAHGSKGVIHRNRPNNQKARLNSRLAARHVANGK